MINIFYVLLTLIAFGVLGCSHDKPNISMQPRQYSSSTIVLQDPSDNRRVLASISSVQFSPDNL
ncbi:MAG: hypothetical protein ABI778_12610, partial [Ignavibacteriota bacterium]